MERSSGSRLMQMQARFQQKQMQEREMKIASLYEAQQARALDRLRHSPSSGVAASPPQPAIPTHPGKVRQMFEERRTKAGIDKSYPLQPIHNTERHRQKTNGFSKVSTSTSNTRASERKATKTSTVTHTHSVRKQQHVTHKLTNNNTVNGSGDLNHNHQPDLNIAKQKPHRNGDIISHKLDELDRAENNYMLENETFPDALAPTPTPRSPEPQPQPQPQSHPQSQSQSKSQSHPQSLSHPQSHPQSQSQSQPQLQSQPPKRPPRKSPAVRKETPSPRSPTKNPVAPPRKVVSENGVQDSSSQPRARGAMQRVSSVNKPLPRKPSPSVGSSGTAPAPARKRSTAAAPGPDSGVPCQVCGRRFAADRIERHQEICRKAANKKRKPFDALKHRLAQEEMALKNCVACLKGKLTAEPYPKASSTRATQPLQLVHSDVCGPVAEASLGGAKYLLTFTDDFTRKSFGYLLRCKSQGTEAEPFIGKLRKQGVSGAASTTKVKTLNNNWRQKHEDFINAIRAAKQVQAHLAAGGKLSDLPPPPPSENPDYVQCPHCGRRFNEAAAARHIPKCANYQYNKPKPGAAPRKR